MKELIYSRRALNALDLVSAGECFIHHHSLARGYISLSQGVFASVYDGKFGVGFVLHYPSRRCPLGTSCGNRYHVVIYVLSK